MTIGIFAQIQYLFTKKKEDNSFCFMNILYYVYQQHTKFKIIISHTLVAEIFVKTPKKGGGPL